jgi:hypothetical protein
MPALTGAVSCGEHGFVRSDPPVARDGVSVALVGQRCGRLAVDPNFDELDLDVVLRATNQSGVPVEVVPAEMRLLARGYSPAPDSTKPLSEDSPMTLPPNSTADVHVRFQRWGNAKCNQDMQLSLDRSLKMSGRDLPLKPLSFVPERSDV